MKSKLKPPGTECLKLKYDNLLSSFAFKFNLRRYTLHVPADILADNTFTYTVEMCESGEYSVAGAYTRSLFSST